MQTGYVISIILGKRRFSSWQGHSFQIFQLVTGTASATPRLLQNSPRNQVIDITQGRVRRTLGHRGPFTGGELSHQTLEQSVEYFHLTFVQRHYGQAIPEPCLAQDRIDCGLGLVDGTMQGVKEPEQPFGDVHRSLLRAFENLVIGLPLALNLARQAIETLRAAIGPRQQQIADGTCDTSVSVVEGVQGDKPEMSHSCLDQRRLFRCVVDPLEEPAHFSLQTSGWRGFEMHLPMADGARNVLHRASQIIAPGPNVQFGQTRISGGKQRGLPSEQALPGHRSVAVGSGVNHHLDHALGVTVCHGQGPDIHAEPSGDRGSDGFEI